MLRACIEAKKQQKIDDALRKVSQKQKSDAIAQLNQVGVPLAKFEQDVASLKACSAEHPLLPSLEALAEEGARIKREAVAAIDHGRSVATSKEAVKKWVADTREQCKIVSAINKATTKKEKA